MTKPDEPVTEAPDAPEAATATGALPTKAHAGRGHATYRPWFKRLRVVGPAAAGAVLLAVGTAVALNQPEPVPVALPSPSPSASPSPSPAFTPLPSSTAHADGPVSTVATVAVEELQVFGAAGAAKPARTLSKWSYYAQPLTMLSLERVQVNGVAWHHVKLPIQPNGAEGWVKESDVKISTTTKDIRVYLDKKVLEFYDGDKRKLKASVVIGRPKTPTPTGTYFVQDLLDLSANSSGIYGAYALGLSAYSENLDEFNGGPPQIAIHGTNEPWLRGYAESNGCIRLSNKDVLKLAKWVEAGTPVHIYDTKPPEDDAVEPSPAP